MKKFIQNNIENLKQHIKLDHPNLANIKVIENNGEYPMTINFTSFNDYGLNLTIQIPSNFKLSNSEITLNCINNNHGEQNLKLLVDHLSNIIKQMDNKNEKLLMKFFDKASEYIEKNFEKNKPSKNPVKSSLESSGEKDEFAKKCSMKTANDVVNRIQWDEEINKDFIVVGYLDRFLGLKECDFNTFDWGDIVLAELGALAIPEHRITYFKYINEVVWDKTSRLDNVFGSTGSNITIRDVIKRLENKNHQ